MKKMIFAALAAAMIFASCSSDPAELPIPEKMDNNNVMVTFTTETATRAYFESQGYAEEWEKAVNMLCIYVFGPNGDKLVEKYLTPAEITAKRAVLALPMDMPGVECSFYALANHFTANNYVIDEADLLSRKENGYNLYNGSFADVTSKSIQGQGFAMSDQVKQALSPLGQVTSVSFTLKRTTAKIAIRTKLISDFSTLHDGGTVVIEDCYLSGLGMRTPYVYQNPIPEQEWTNAWSQISEYSEGNYQNLVYIFERPGIENQPLTITLRGYFDEDGNLATTTDRKPVLYPIILNPEGNSEIKRNSYFRIDATIKGLNGLDTNTSFSVAEWDNTGTQYPALG